MNRVTVSAVTQDTQESQALGVTDVKFTYCCLLCCVQVVRNSHISVVTILLVQSTVLELYVYTHMHVHMYANARGTNIILVLYAAGRQ